MPAVEWYHRKAEECVALAKAASLNDERARLYALAEYYMRLALNPRTGEARHSPRPAWALALNLTFENRSIKHGRRA
jgi:hypothetical protein